jgi:hypothetical protein
MREIVVVTNLVLGGAATRGAMANTQQAQTEEAQTANQQQPPGEATTNEATTNEAATKPGNAPAGMTLFEPTPVLARLHQAAAREIQLAELAQGGGGGRDTRAYGASLATDFKGLDDRIVSFAALRGIGEEALNSPFPGDNLVAMRQQVTDLGRLADTHGVQFDREFWVAIAGEQSAASDMLPKTMVAEPSISALVSEFSQTLERASAEALIASRPTTAAAPTRALNSPAETPPCASACR